MTKLVLISGKKFCKILEKLGFEKIYGKGSHVRFKHPDGRRTVVPVHGNQEVFDYLSGLLDAQKCENQ